MKNKQPERKLSPSIGLTRHLISGVVAFGALVLSCSSASAQNLFATDVDTIDKFTPNGVRSTFASGLNNPLGLAFDRAGNLFVADTGTYTGTGAVYKFTPAGVRTTFASGLNFPRALAFDSQGNLFVMADDVTIYKFTPSGARTTFATVQSGAYGLAFDRVGNLFVAAGFSLVNNDHAGTVYKFTPTGVRTTFASGLNSPLALAFDSQGNLFVADQGYGYDILLDAAVYKFTPSGLRSTVASENDQVPVIPSGLAIDGADNLFISDYWVSGNILKFTPSGVRTIFAARNYVTAMAFQPSAAQLLNISTRARVLTQDEVLIGGFIITGTQNKTVLIRGIGPSLSAFGLAVPLTDPTLELHDHTRALIASNDNWKDSQQSQISATGLAPSSDFESVILATLAPGAYTAVLRGKAMTTGTGLVEIYDVDQNANTQITNLSSRGFVGTGDDVMIGGTIFRGSPGAAYRILVRAIGPSLASFGVASPLLDPALSLHDANGNVIATDDNWKDSQQLEIAATGLGPTDDRESVIIATLPAGAYTAIVRGVNGTTGVGLVEVFNLH
jgi:sugar lactone lactonase YvrE